MWRDKFSDNTDLADLMSVFGSVFAFDLLVFGHFVFGVDSRVDQNFVYFTMC